MRRRERYPMREKSSVSALTLRPPERLRSAFKSDFLADL